MKPDPCLEWGVTFLLLASFLWIRTVQQHSSYWHVTLQRVQVTDFSLLHATLPYALVFPEENGRRDLIQPILDSHLGLFGMVYTDVSGQVLMKTDTRGRGPQRQAVRGAGLDQTQCHGGNAVVRTFQEQWGVGA